MTEAEEECKVIHFAHIENPPRVNAGKDAPQSNPLITSPRQECPWRGGPQRGT